jgi:hypothetical protein
MRLKIIEMKIHLIIDMTYNKFIKKILQLKKNVSQVFRSNL